MVQTIDRQELPEIIRGVMDGLRDSRIQQPSPQIQLSSAPTLEGKARTPHDIDELARRFFECKARQQEIIELATSPLVAKVERLEKMDKQTEVVEQLGHLLGRLIQTTASPQFNLPESTRLELNAPVVHIDFPVREFALALGPLLVSGMQAAMRELLAGLPQPPAAVVHVAQAAAPAIPAFPAFPEQKAPIVHVAAPVNAPVPTKTVMKPIYKRDGVTIDSIEITRVFEDDN